MFKPFGSHCLLKLFVNSYLPLPTAFPGLISASVPLLLCLKPTLVLPDLASLSLLALGSK